MKNLLLSFWKSLISVILVVSLLSANAPLQLVFAQDGPSSVEGDSGSEALFCIDERFPK